MNTVTKLFAAKGALLLFGLLSLEHQAVSPMFIMGLFVVVGAGFAVLAVENRWFRLLVLGGGCLLAVLVPAVKPFLPMLAFDAVYTGTWPVLVLFVPGAAVPWAGWYKALFPAVGCLLGGVMAWLMVRQEEGERQRILYRDAAETRDLRLQRENKDLLQRQDYEIYAATLKERNRIAREIHDNVGHLLSRTILMTGALKAVNRDPGMEESLDQLDRSLNQAMDAIRSSVHDLHDEAVDLREAAEGIVGSFSFCEIRMDYQMGQGIPREVKYCFLNILKEALANVIKHSNARLVEVRMIEHPAMYQMTVEDDGTTGELGAAEDHGPGRSPFAPRSGLTERQGAPGAGSAGWQAPAETAAPSRKAPARTAEPSRRTGIGLGNMEERVRALGGTIQFSRQAGFRIFISVPKATAGRAPAGAPEG